MAHVLLSLGSNLGQPEHLLRRAREELRRRGIRLLRASRTWRTRAVGGPPKQGEFLNQVLLAETSLSPHTLLGVLLESEQALGRVRHRRWAARTIDIDLLLYEQQVLHTAELQLPHPRMSFRRFVLQPAVEVAAGMVHPVAGRTLQDLLDHLDRAPAVVWIAEQALWHCAVAAGEKRFRPDQEARREEETMLRSSGEDPPWDALRLRRFETGQALQAFCRRRPEGEAGSLTSRTWGVWVGEAFPAAEAIPRLVVAGEVASGAESRRAVRTGWQRAVGRVGPHLLGVFPTPEHFRQELKAALLATEPAAILGPGGS